MAEKAEYLLMAMCIWMGTTIAVVATLPLPLMGEILSGWRFATLWGMFLVLLVMVRFEYGDILLEQPGSENEVSVDDVDVPDFDDLPDVDDL